MKKITKIGISAISAAAVAGVGYLGKKVYDKKKNKPIEDTENANTVTPEPDTINETPETEESK